jgi:hypothetical protein
MTLFSYINDILFNRTGKLFSKSGNDYEFNTYMVSRFISMRSTLNILLLSKTINILPGALDTKKHWYQLFLSVIPKCPYKRISYIKKKKPVNTSSKIDTVVRVLAQRERISEREIRSYIVDNNIDVTSLSKILGDDK